MASSISVIASALLTFLVILEASTKKLAASLSSPRAKEQSLHLMKASEASLHDLDNL